VAPSYDLPLISSFQIIMELSVCIYSAIKRVPKMWLGVKEGTNNITKSCQLRCEDELMSCESLHSVQTKHLGT
jgi:hypothetical protein